MRRKRGRKVRRLLATAVAALLVAAAAFLLARSGVRSLGSILSRGPAGMKLAKAEDLHKTVVVIGAEETESKNLASGVLLVQIDGAKRELNAISITPNTFVEVPGQGFERIAEALQSGPDTVVDSVSNLLGVRAKKYVLVSESDLQRLLDKQQFSGFTGMGLKNNMSKANSSRIEELVKEVPAEKVSVVPLPVEPVSIGTEMYYQPKKDDIDKLVAGWWQVRKRTEKPRLRVMVLNGAGVPGIAGEVASVLIGRGYQVVDSKNADSFNYQQTLILLYHGKKEDGLAIRQVLGTGKVMVKDIPQDIADVSIVVGKDYLSKPKGGKGSGG